MCLAISLTVCKKEDSKGKEEKEQPHLFNEKKYCYVIFLKPNTEECSGQRGKELARYEWPVKPEEETWGRCSMGT